MKICTITCHNVYNYGASLQAFALQEYLKINGHDVEIIDYLPWYHKIKYNPFMRLHNRNTGNKYCDRFPILLLPYHIKSFFHIYTSWEHKRKKAFDQFTSKYLQLTKKEYSTFKCLQRNVPVADLYITGSDQIWNVNMPNGKDSSYYLAFVQNKKKISYAASLAFMEIPNELEQFIVKNVSSFNAVSVREESGKIYLESLGLKPVTCVMDPVFLLNKNQWINYSQDSKIYSIPSKYILLYNFIKDDNEINKFALCLSESCGLPIVSINDQYCQDIADYNLNDAGPFEFVSLINNASYVISNSFHATVLSIILEKEFYTFGLRKLKNSSRMTDFLTRVGLMERYNPVSICDTEIDYLKVKNNYSGWLDNSVNFLQTNIL